MRESLVAEEQRILGWVDEQLEGAVKSLIMLGWDRQIEIRCLHGPLGQRVIQVYMPTVDELFNPIPTWRDVFKVHCPVAVHDEVMFRAEWVGWPYRWAIQGTVNLQAPVEASPDWSDVV